MLNNLYRTLRQKLRFISPASKGLSASERVSYDRYRRIIFSSIAGSAGKFSIALIGLITIPLVINHLGKDQYAVWMIISSLIIWMQLADFGVGNGLTNALSEANGRDDTNAAVGYLSTALITMCLLSITLAPLIYVAYKFISWGWLLNVESPALELLSRDAMLVVCLAFIVNMPLSLSGRVYLAYQRGFVTSISQVITALSTLIGTFFAIKLKLDLVWLIGISAFIPVGINLFLWFGFPLAKIPLKFSWTCVHVNFLSRVSKSSIPMFIFQCGALLINEMVNIAIAHLATLSMVTDYNILLRIYLFAFALAAAFSNPFYPAIREAFERGESAWVSNAIRNSLVLRLSATLPPAIIFLFAGDFIVKMWIGDSTIEPLGIFGWISIVICMWLATISSLLSEVLTSLDDIWAQIIFIFLTAAVVLGLMILLIPKLGVIGVFIAMSISTFIPIAWSSKRLFKRFNAAT